MRTGVQGLFFSEVWIWICVDGGRGGGGGGGFRVIYFKFSASRRIYLKHYVA